jgi:hypothetical protein
MNLYKTYIDTDKPNHKIKFTIHFNKDTHHWATSSPKKKGYAVTATPVEISDRWESSGAFTGFYEIIYPVERQSQKRLLESIDKLNNKLDTYLDFFRNRGHNIAPLSTSDTQQEISGN